MLESGPGLYHPSFERDACGIGFVASIKGIKSHQHISDALTVLENMEHRGACGCEENSGDGAGIMIQVPHEFFYEECLKQGVHLPGLGQYGVGVIFFPQNIALREACREAFNRSAEKLGLEILCYRKVPVNKYDIGETALSVEPEMEQVFIAMPNNLLFSAIIPPILWPKPLSRMPSVFISHLFRTKLLYIKDSLRAHRFAAIFPIFLKKV
jgi:glutamate synthase (NADPH/NADH) large chain